MHIKTHLLSVLGLAAFAAAAAFAPPHPCKAFSTKVTILATCSSKSAFCSSYLDGTASFTRTATTTTTVPSAPVTTTVTETDTETDTETVNETVTATDTVTTTVVTSFTSTTTTYSSVCDNPQKLKARSPVTVAAAAAATISCGLAAGAQSSEVSGACNCILASSTTVTSTTTSGVAPVQTVTETDTVTESDTVTATSTTTPTSTSMVNGVETACATSFFIMLDNAEPGSEGGYSDSDGDYAMVSGSNINLLNSNYASASLFQIDPEGYLEYAGVDLDVVENQQSGVVSGSGSSGSIEAPDAFMQGDQGLRCQIAENLQLICSASRPDGQWQTVYWSCADATLGIEHQPQGCPYFELYILPSDGVPGS